MTAEINGRPPKKVWEAIFYPDRNSRIEAYILAVSETKAKDVMIKRFPRARILLIRYYGEIFK